jgi:hypothetical protein
MQSHFMDSNSSLTKLQTMTTPAPDFRALCKELAVEVEDWMVGTDHRPPSSVELVDRARTALATPPGPFKNCWLDDEPYLCPSPCVFDDPSEVISNCTYAQTVKCKTDCQYYRAAAPPPEPPTDEEIEEWADAATEVPLEEMDPDIHGWQRCFTKEEFCASIRAALERWGRA